MSDKSDTIIRKMSVRVFRVPLETPESDGTLKWSSTTLVLVELSAGGMTGIGYTYSHPSAGTLLQMKFRELVEGSDALAVEATTQKLLHASRNLGTEGIVSYAVSAVNVALWDLKARLLGLPLVDLFGAVRARVPIYGSGGFTSYTIDQLRSQMTGWCEAGIRQVKMKIGRHPDADVSRVRAVREAIGEDVGLFVDANGAYSVKSALEKAKHFAELGVSWFEEPVPSADLCGLRKIRERAPAEIEVTAGEYGNDSLYFRRMLEAGAVDVLMADGTRCGGFSGVLKASALCEAFMIPLSAHTAPNLHAHVCCATESVRHVEYFHDHVRVEQLLFDGVLDPGGGDLEPDRTVLGHGLSLRESVATQYEVTTFD